MKTSHYIDLPKSWTALSRALIVHGWCFPLNGGTISGIRLRTQKLCLHGIVGIQRPDVRAEIPEAPDNFTGFEVRGILPVGKNTIWLEALLPDGTWHLLLSVTAVVRRNWVPRWLGLCSWTELIFFQMPGHMKHPPRPAKLERFRTESKKDLHRPKLSIVTPSYQQARYLAETLRSILNQTQVNCEYVVQDGGSSDGSVEIIRSLANPQCALPPHHSSGSPNDPDGSSPLPPTLSSGRSEAHSTPRLTHWESCRDAGQADAIVRGFAKTSGGPDDLMAWINSDDFYLPGALNFVVDYFARHPEVDAVYGHRILVDENSLEIGRWFLPAHDNKVVRLCDFIPQETLFWRRRIWDKVGGLDKTFQFAMDWDLLLKFQSAGAKIVRVPYFLGCFRIHTKQKTSAVMHTTGDREITFLRERTHGRPVPPEELLNSPRLRHYLQKSAWIEFLWKLGIRSR